MSIDLKNYEDLITCEDSLVGAMVELSVMINYETGKCRDIYNLIAQIPDQLRRLGVAEDEVSERYNAVMAKIMSSVITDGKEQETNTFELAFA